jgi:predicted PurR-regulated permease PerM
MLFFVFSVWLMVALDTIAITALISLLAAYLLSPAATRLERLGLPRSLASLLVILGCFAVILALVFITLPAVLGELAAFARKAPDYISRIIAYSIRVLGDLNIAPPDSWMELLNMLKRHATDWNKELLNIGKKLAELAGGVFKSSLSLLLILFQALLIPVLTYYFLASFHTMSAKAEELIPSYAHDAVIRKVGEIDRIVSGFVRGQFTVCLCLAFLYTAGFLWIGIDLAIVIGVVSGLLFIIPYVGTAFGLVFGSLMAFAAYGDLAHPLYVVCWIGVVQTFEGYVLTPRIVGHAVGLHPVVYILALMTGAKLLGLVGMLIAVPVAAIIKVLLVSAVERYKQSEIYLDPRPGDPS